MGGKNVFVLQVKSINALCAKYHTSLDEGMNCVGSDKFPALSNGILKPHVLLWFFRNSLLQFSRSYREITFSSGKSAVITGKHTCLYCWGLWIHSVSQDGKEAAFQKKTFWILQYRCKNVLFTGKKVELKGPIQWPSVQSNTWWSW